MPHSIFIKERKGDVGRPPELVAYDIDSVALANRLVRSIAKSNRVNGFRPYDASALVQIEGFDLLRVQNGDRIQLNVGAYHCHDGTPGDTMAGRAEYRGLRLRQQLRRRPSRRPYVW